MPEPALIVNNLLTARLHLRPPGREDAPAIFERFSADPEVTRYLAWPRHRSVEDALGFVQFSNSEWSRWPAGPYLIESLENGELLGSTGLAFETPYRASTGFVLARDAWGEGYATEVLQTMVELARQLGVLRLYALCHTDHRDSARVLEKAGFQFEGIQHGYLKFPNLDSDTPLDVDCYARLFEAPAA